MVGGNIELLPHAGAEHSRQVFSVRTHERGTARRHFVRDPAATRHYRRRKKYVAMATNTYTTPNITFWRSRLGFSGEFALPIISAPLTMPITAASTSQRVCLHTAK